MSKKKELTAEELMARLDADRESMLSGGKRVATKNKPQKKKVAIKREPKREPKATKPTLKIDKSKKNEKSFNLVEYRVSKKERENPSQFSKVNKVFEKEIQMETRVSPFDSLIGITGPTRENALPTLTEVREPKSQPFFPAKQPAQNIGSISIPTNASGTINVSQSGVFSVKSIPSKRSSNAGGGGSGGGGGGGGGGGRGFGGGGGKKPKPPSKPKEQRKRQREATKSIGEKKIGLVRAKVKAPQKPLGGVKRGSVKEKKPKRDITKITTPKPKGKVQSASGTIQKKVGGGKVRATEQTRPQVKSRIQGEVTTTYGKKSKMRGERTTIR